MLVCETVPEEPEAPLFYFDGRQAVLKRRTGQFIVFPLLKTPSKTVGRNRKIMMTEMNGTEIVRVYEAAVRFVGPDELPSAGKKENIG